MRVHLSPILLALGALTAACRKEVADPQCGQRDDAAIGVRIRDSVSGAYFPFQNISYVAVTDDGSFKDSVFVQTILDPGQVPTIEKGLAYEHPGTYTLTVKANGYSPWTQSNISAPESGCHVLTQHITPRLKPL